MLYKPSPDELTHHGVLGMKWGVRRFQNADGSLTPAGEKRVSKQYEKEYMTAFEKDRLKNYAKTYVSELEKDENYRKAESLVKQYDMTKFNDLARENAKGREEVEKIITGKAVILSIPETSKKKGPGKKEDVQKQKLQKRAAELASKYGDKATVEVKDDKILVTTSDGDKWRVY